eukprot:1157902-Pelagomonas_calceolata.AAC.6
MATLFDLLLGLEHTTFHTEVKSLQHRSSRIGALAHHNLDSHDHNTDYRKSNKPRHGEGLQATIPTCCLVVAALQQQPQANGAPGRCDLLSWTMAAIHKGLRMPEADKVTSNSALHAVVVLQLDCARPEQLCTGFVGQG